MEREYARSESRERAGTADGILLYDRRESKGSALKNQREFARRSGVPDVELPGGCWFLSLAFGDEYITEQKAKEVLRTKKVF